MTRRVLSVIETLGKGGAERSLITLLPAFASHGYQCEVVALCPPYDLAGELEAAGVPVHRLDLGSVWDFPRGLWRLRRVVRNGRFHVVHGHLFFAGIYVAALRLLVGGPARVVTFHNLGYDSYPANTRARRLLKRVNAWCMQHGIHGYTAVSHAVARHYQMHLHVAPITVIYNPLPETPAPMLTAAEVAAERARYDVEGDCMLIVSPGRFVHEKGHRYMLEAVKLLRDGGVQVCLLLIGEGPLKVAVRGDIEGEGLQREVRVHDTVPQSALLRLLAAADVYLMASTHEGFPLTPAEAMLVGAPVVATHVGGIPELVEDGTSGLLVEARNPEAIAAAVMRLHNDAALRASLIAAARQRVRAMLGIGRIVVQWDAFYQRILRDR